MKKDYCIAVIQKAKDASEIKKMIGRFSTKSIIVCEKTDNNFGNNCEFVISKESNNAKSKNKCIKYAIDNGYKYLFILQDEVEIKDYRIFEEYISCMKTHDLYVMSNGYTGGANYVYNIPNPCANIKYKNKNFIFNRFIGRDFMVIKINADTLMFDENLNVLENEYYVDLYEKVDLRFEHFRMDIENAWKYVKKTELEKELSAKEIEADKKYKGFSPASPKNIDTVIAFLHKKYIVNTTEKEFKVV